jgi:DNA-3-methyladenine glycosylase II
MTTFVLRPRGPFSFDRALDVLSRFPPLVRHRPANDGVVRLAFPLDGDFTPVAVALRWDGEALHGEASGTHRTDAVRAQVARIFSLDHDGAGFEALGEDDAKLRRVMAALAGLRPVCFTSPYEAAAWAVISQRIAATQAARVLERFVVERGTAIEIAGRVVHAFPRPEVLATIDAIEGIAPIKIERLRGVAAAALEGRLDAERLRTLGDDEGPASLRSIPGIGPFWSSGIYLRACGIVDVFPEEPLSIAALGRLYGLGDRPSPDAVRRVTDRFRPFRMWTCFLLRVAAARGIIEGVAGREGAIRAVSRARRTRASTTTAP